MDDGGTEMVPIPLSSFLTAHYRGHQKRKGCYFINFAKPSATHHHKYPPTTHPKVSPDVDDRHVQGIYISNDPHPNM